MEKICHANSNQNRAGVAILISNKIDLKPKSVIRERESHFIIIKGSINQEDTTIINIYALNNRAPKHMNQTVTEFLGEIDN